MDIIGKILDFNKQIQEGQGLKILTPDRMLGKLPISLAQLKAGNDSEKQKNEIRQLLCSLHRSKHLTKTIYEYLTNTIQNMKTIFMNTENSRINEPHRFSLALPNKRNFKDPNKNIDLDPNK